VVGRKNWLFDGDEAGVAASCRVYSLMETAKRNELEPKAYLSTVFDWLLEVQLSGAWESLQPLKVRTGGMCRLRIATL